MIRLMRDRKSGEIYRTWFADTDNKEKANLGHCGNFFVFNPTTNMGIKVPLQEHITPMVLSLVKETKPQALPDWLDAYIMSMNERGVLTSIEERNGQYVEL